jgi:integrase
MIAVLIGCGLRRAEAAALKLEDVQLREEHWAIADLNGKGGHIRTVPMPDWVKRAIDEWGRACWTHFRLPVPSHQQGRTDVGKWLHAKGDLVDR